MKKQLITLTALFLLFLSRNISIAQENNSDEAIKEGIQMVNASLLKGDFKEFMEVNSLFERILSVAPENYLAKYYRAFIGYRLILFKQVTPGVNVDKYYQPAVDLCKELIEKKKYDSDARAVLAGLYMMNLAENPMDAMSTIPIIFELLEKAEKMDSENPRPFIIKGILLLNMPPIAGGSVEQSLTCFTKAISLFEADKKEKPINWGYAESHAWLGQAYQRLNNIEKAKETYEKILKIEPEYAWVKYSLLPGLQKEIKK
jgi:tetratricopeptide (TPR) repeat protein